MNQFDKLMALGVARSRAITGQQVTIGAVANIGASVSPIRREARFDADGISFMVDAADVTIGMDVWPANTALPLEGQLITLASGDKYRVGPVNAAPAAITFTFTSQF